LQRRSQTVTPRALAPGCNAALARHRRSAASAAASQFDPAQSQETPAGFLFPYGDYTGLILNSACTTPAPAMTWGEGHSWTGGATAPGHIEFASFC